MNSGRTIFQLVTRLNEIMVEQNRLEIKSMELEKEWNDIVFELWGKVPHLKYDETIQPIKKRRLIKDEKDES